MSRSENDQNTENISNPEATFTPRRSLRLRHDMSLINEKSIVEAHAAAGDCATPAKILPRKSVEIQKSEDDERTESAAPKQNSSGEKANKKPKKQNKKSKKQKAKANQKRKQAKKAAHLPTSDEIESIPSSPRLSGTSISEDHKPVTLLVAAVEPVNEVITVHSAAPPSTSVNEAVVAVVTQSPLAAAVEPVNEVITVHTPASEAVVAIVTPLATPMTVRHIGRTPLKSALRSRRSRSLGSDDLLNTIGKKNRVVFNSPSNMTINIDDVDLLMKTTILELVDVEEDGPSLNESHVTVPRKRSMSMVETEADFRSMEASGHELSAKKAKVITQPLTNTTITKNKAINMNAVRKIQEKQKITVPISIRKKQFNLNATGKVEEKKKNMATVSSDKRKLINLDAVGKKADKVSDQKLSSHLCKSNTSIANDHRDEKNDFIVGVRSNRRFILQMQYRDRMK